MNITAIIIIGVLALFIGIGMGYWFAYFTKISDLITQNARWRARCEDLNDLLDYYENKDKKNYKMKKLNEFDIEDLTNDWIFFSLSDFIYQVEHGCFVDDIGNGEFIYIDKNGTMYLKDNEYFCPSEIVETINLVYKNNKLASCIDVVKALREKYSNSDYKLFAIFWHNK